MENETPRSSNLQKFLPFIIVILIVAAGVLTGYLLKTKGSAILSGDNKVVVTETEVGSKNTRVFKDEASGTLEKGGLDNEGTHKLIREGGPSQTVYLTSSVVDLDQFAGKKVQVWGETFKGQKAAWLMDVGRVKLAE